VATGGVVTEHTGLVDVLVVDDDEAMGALLMHALATRGYKSEWVRDGAEAATMLVEHKALGARVVLLDVGLPGLDGLSVLRRLGETGLLRSTRVIMLTLRSSDAEVVEALDLGAFDHVAKPFSLPVLLHRIRRALDSPP
jgi:DNA-binding response OmpR family regulator